MWNSNSNGTSSAESQTQEVKIKCNSKEYKENLSGVQLIDRIKQIARENQIGKFDLFDETMRMLNPAEVESGNFTGEISIIRFNQAAQAA